MVMMFLRLICVVLITLMVSACSPKEEPAAEVTPEVIEPVVPAAAAPSEPAVEKTPPQLISREMPEFPEELAIEQVEGEVVLQFKVSEAGEVENPIVISATHDLFSASALKAIKNWRFRPSLADGKPVSTERVVQRFPFIVARPQPDEYLNGEEDRPILIYVERPEHPGLRQSGKALINISLDRTALVKNVEILEATGSVNTDEIVAAVRNWAFQPFQKDGQYVATQVSAEIEFTPHGTVLVQYPARD